MGIFDDDLWGFSKRRAPKSTDTCSEPGCDESPLILGLCDKHYAQSHADDDPNTWKALVLAIVFVMWTLWEFPLPFSNELTRYAQVEQCDARNKCQFFEPSSRYLFSIV